jgi:hypothetical protein
MGQEGQGVIGRVTVVTPEQASSADLGTERAATLLGLSRRTLLRIPKDQLDYWETPGGGIRRHRRYRRQDLERYARDVLGRALVDES